MISKQISIVSPVYNAETILEKLVSELKSVLQEMGVTYEIIFVDDRSQDQSWKKMLSLSKQHKELKIVRLSRNFGQHPAIMAGLSQAKGDWVVVMDCDLQDRPKEIIKLYNKALEGYDIVLAKRKFRKDGFIKKMSSLLFSKAYHYFTDMKYNHEIGNFGIYKNKVIIEILKMGDYIKSFALFQHWVGFNSTEIDVEHGESYSGKSTYTYSKLMVLAFNTIISFSNKPIRMFVKLGLLISFLSFFVGIYTIYSVWKGEISLGYSSIILSIWFLSGIIITTIGVTGIYVGKIFDQTKNRQTYIIDNIVEHD